MILISHLGRGRATALRRVRLGQVIAVLLLRAMEGLFEDGLGLIDLELGLEVGGVMGKVAAVGAATGVGEAEVFVGDVIVNSAPIASARAVLLHLLGIHVEMAMLGEEARKMLSWGGSALGKTLVVTIVGLVGASHFDGSRESC